MTVEVLYFASLVEVTGKSGESFELDDAADVKQLWDSVVEHYPVLAGLHYRPMVACDMEYAGWDASLDGVAEVAFLPPVSGG